MQIYLPIADLSVNIFLVLGMGIISGMHGMVAEGVLTTKAAVGLARKYAVEMPITEQIDAILNQGKAPREAIHELMTRPGASEVALYRP